MECVRTYEEDTSMFNEQWAFTITHGLRNELNSYPSYTSITWVGTVYDFYKPLI